MGAGWRTEVRSRPGLVIFLPRLAGEGAELAMARSFADEVAQAQVETNGLLFIGTRGIGKTTLLHGVAVDLRSQGWRVAVVVRGDEHPVNEVLRDSLDTEGMRGTGARFRDRVRSLAGVVKGGNVSVGLRDQARQST